MARLLDLFCGAGGAGWGYHRAGFEVIGVDIKPQPRYPFAFVQMDALKYLRTWIFEDALIDAIHASPPCQRWSESNGAKSEAHPDLITPLRPLLEATSLPYVIENVRHAPLLSPFVLCGSSVGLRVRRHRSFETNFSVVVPPCAHGLQRSNPHRLRSGYEPPDDAIVPVYGGGQAGFSIARCRAAMGIDWMTTDELNEAIPPAYTELIGHQLIQHVRAKAAA